MKAAIKSIYLMTTLSLLAIAAYADNPSTTSTPTLAGNYQCTRDTNTYPLTITDNGGTYTFEWDSSGNPVLFGTGVVHPDMKNLVSVSFSDPKNTSNFGIELVELKPDGSLQSTWALQSASQTGSETCTRSK